MSGDFLDALAEIVVKGVHAVLFLVGGDRTDSAVIARDLADEFADLRAVGNLLGDDIHRAGKRLFGVLHALFLADKLAGVGLGRKALFLTDDRECQGFESFFLGNAGSGLALRTERTVDILQFAESRRLVERCADLVGELFLSFDQGAYFLSALVQTAQIIEFFAEFTDQLVVHGAVHFLAVTGDERDRVAVVEQGDDVLRVLLFGIE